MTANGTDISDGASLSGSQVVRVYGSNLTPPYFSLWFNGVEYTPLDYGDGYVEYLLQDNGTYEINLEGRVFMSFEIDGVVVPSGLPCNMAASQKSDTVISGVGANYVGKINVNCINYPYKATAVLPRFRYTINVDSDATSEDFAFTNATINASDVQENPSQVRVIFTPIDSNLPVVVRYKGFIVAVLNYTTTP